MRKLIPITLLLLAYFTSSSQDAATSKASPGSNKFVVYGNSEMTYTSEKGGSKSFGEVNFKPILLWRISPKLFVEAEMEIETGGGAADLGLEYANMCYMVNPT